nr:sodium:proton antiporter [Ralstonia sp. ASV6]
MLVAGGLLAVVALVQMLASRLTLPESTLLALAGIGIGGAYVGLQNTAPAFATTFFAPLIDPSWPAEAYLWLFLPPLLFQAALSVDVRSMAPDAAPILMLAIVAVIVATGVIGLAAAAVTPFGIVTCLLLGAMIATTDPSAVIAVFRDVGAPARLIRLVEGEALLNDAAAIAIMGVLLAMLTGHGTDATVSGGLRELAKAFGGGVLFGLIAGRVAAFLLPALHGIAQAEAAWTLALPYPLYLVAENVLDVSGVVSVVCAGLVIGALGRTRLAPRNWSHLQLIWEQIAALAGAVVFLLAAVRVPELLHGVVWKDALWLAVVVVAALAARLAVLFGLLPALAWCKLSAPVSHAYKLAIAWGGLRGAVTLVLALGVAENAAVHVADRHFVTILATGFVLVSVLFNGATLRWVMHQLGLDQLSPQEQALQRQALNLSTVEVESIMRRIGGHFHFAAGATDQAAEAYRLEVAAGAAELNLEDALSERERLTIGLVSLATRERELIPEYGNGLVSIRNLDVMMRNTADMIDAARAEGRVGYKRASRRILAKHIGYRAAFWIHRVAHIDRPLANALADRFELLVCRQTVLERLRAYNCLSLQPVLGERMADLLDGVLIARIEAAEEGLTELRDKFGDYSAVLEKRLLLLFALHIGQNKIDAMLAETVISKEVYKQISGVIRRAWSAALPRPPLGVSLRTLRAQQASAPQPPG